MVVKPTFTNEDAKKAIEWIQTNSTCSYWLQDALKASLTRDPVDAYKDVSLLKSILKVVTKNPLQLDI